MVYLVQTLKYIKKSFWQLALICLPAAIVLGVFSQPIASISYLPQYATTDVQTFFTVWWLILRRFSLKMIFPVLLMIVAVFLTACMSFSLIEKHFRIGKLSFRKIFSDINSYFIPVLILLLILTLALALYFMLSASLVSLQHFLVSGVGKPSFVSIILAAIISIGLLCFALYLVSPLIFLIPNMYIYGYSFTESLTNSYRNFEKSPFKISIGMIFPMLLVALVETFLMVLNFNAVLNAIISSLIYLLILIYIYSYILTTSFSVMGMERKDIQKYY